MTRKSLTEIVCIVDRSGSMESMRKEAIKGFNLFLEEQKILPGTAKLTYVQFDNEYDRVCTCKPIGEVRPLTTDTYKPRGLTALFDAVCRTIIEVGSRLNSMNESDRPEKVIVVILTDGLENASKEFAGYQVKEMIEHQRSKYNWEFVFLASNMDAVLIGQSLGILGANCYTYAPTGQGIRSAYVVMTSAVSSYRNTGDVDMGAEPQTTTSKKN